MVLKKKSCQVSTTPNGDGAAKNNNGIHRISTQKDKHWDFLDEIEAPMWVDLNQECQSSYQIKDAEWFNISHPFHQYSAKELISAFSQAGEGCTNLELCGQEQRSPKLPSSVSRSRGKDYRSREWGQKNHMATFDLQKSVKDLRNKISSVNSAIADVSSDKTRDVRSMDLAGSQSNSTGKTNFSEITAQHDQPVPPCRDHRCSNPISSKGGESSLTHTITSEGSVHQQQRSLEVSSQVIVQTSQLLSELKISLRKSCVARKSSGTRVTARRQSQVRNYPSSKSSVGSSSSLGCVVENLSVRQNKGKTPGTTYATGATIASRDNTSTAMSSKAPAAKRDITSKLNSRSQSSTLPSIKQENAKGKVESRNIKASCDVQQQSLQRKVLVHHHVDKRFPLAVASKVKENIVATSDQIPAGGKENQAWKVATEQVWKVNRRKLPVRCGKTKLF